MRIHGDYPHELRKTLDHASRFARVLATMEREATAEPWVKGRADELRALVLGTLRDWRTGAIELEEAVRRVTSRVDELHRQAALRRGERCVFGCCGTDDAVTAAGEDLTDPSPVPDPFAEQLHAAAETLEATARTPWKDAPEMLARFRAELAAVPIHARAMKRRIGRACPLEDLVAFGREGLLDAARSFNEGRGVPFSVWATVRIRSAMIDGLRRWGVSRSTLRELESTADRSGDVTAKPIGRDDHDDAEEPRVRGALLLPNDEMDAGFAIGGPTPEELFEQAELAASVRQVIDALPFAQREVVRGLYFNDQTLLQAAAGAGVGESWGCRLHARALAQMERQLTQVDSDPTPSSA